jgi:hypothetical protein
MAMRLPDEEMLRQARGLYGQIAGEFASAHAGLQPAGWPRRNGFVLEMTASSGTIYYTLTVGPGIAQFLRRVQRTLLIPENGRQARARADGPVDYAWGVVRLRRFGLSLADRKPRRGRFERSVGYEISFLSSRSLDVWPA